MKKKGLAKPLRRFVPACRNKTTSGLSRARLPRGINHQDRNNPSGYSASLVSRGSCNFRATPALEYFQDVRRSDGGEILAEFVRFSGEPRRKAMPPQIRTLVTANNSHPSNNRRLIKRLGATRAPQLRIYGNYRTNEFRVFAKSRATVVYLACAERYLFPPSFTIFIYRPVTTY